MIDFPASPTLNQIHTAAGRSWRWNGTVWEGISSSGGGGVTSYNDLTDKPTLGTAAAASTSDFATAAQGANAIAKNPSDTTPVSTIRCMTQVEYDALGTYDAQTLYFIK